MIIQNSDKCYEVINQLDCTDNIREFLCRDQELEEDDLLVQVTDPILAEKFTLFLEEKVKDTAFWDYKGCFRWEDSLYAIFSYSREEILKDKLEGENLTGEERAVIFCKLLEKMLLLSPHPYLMKNALESCRVTVSGSLDVSWNYHLEEEESFDDCKMDTVCIKLAKLMELLFNKELNRKQYPMLEQYLVRLTDGEFSDYMELYEEFVPLWETLCKEEKEPQPQRPWQLFWQRMKKVFHKPDSVKGYFRIGKHYIARKAAFVFSLLILLMLLLLSLSFVWIGYPWIQSRFFIKTMVIHSVETEGYTGRVRLIDDTETGNVIFLGRLVEGKMEGEGKLYNEAGELVYEGGFLDGLYEGEGKYYYMGQIPVYEGSFQKGLYEGDGTLYYVSGQVRYKGEFIEGEYEGSGTLYFIEGMPSYEGEFLKGEKSGSGKEYDQNGDLIYDGGFFKNLYEGEGTKYRNGKIICQGSFHLGNLTTGETVIYDNQGNLRYQGSIRNGLYDGEGKLYWNGILIYEGGFLEGKYHGSGKAYIKENGRTLYDGMFDKGEYSGEGRLYDEETGGLLYEGSFYQGLYDGEGKLYDPVKGYLVYEGNFREGQYDGMGKSYYKGALAYEGEFLLGTYNGKGILYDQNLGTVVFEGIFYDNQPIHLAEDNELQENDK